MELLLALLPIWMSLRNLGGQDVTASWPQMLSHHCVIYHGMRILVHFSNQSLLTTKMGGQLAFALMSPVACEIISKDQFFTGELHSDLWEYSFGSHPLPIGLMHFLSSPWLCYFSGYYVYLTTGSVWLKTLLFSFLTTSLPFFGDDVYEIFINIEVGLLCCTVLRINMQGQCAMCKVALLLGALRIVFSLPVYCACCSMIFKTMNRKSMKIEIWVQVV